MKRLLSLMLVALLVLALGVGCSNNDAATPAPATSVPSSTTAAAPATSAQVPQEPEVQQLSELTISFGGLTADPSDHAMGQYIKENFGITFVPIETDAEKLRMLATADDLPDLFGVTSNALFYKQLREDGQVRTVPEDMLAKYPMVENQYRTGMISSAIYEETGSFWAIPMRTNPAISEVPIWLCFQYRSDWAENVGITSAPTNMVEFAEMLRRFTFNDPIGTGEKTFGFSGWIYGAAFFPWTDYEHYVFEDGQWMPARFSNGAREALIYWNNLYKEGIIDPEFSNVNADELFITDKIGTVLRRYDEYGIRDLIVNKFGPAHPDLDPLETVKFIPPMSVDGTQPPLWAKDIDDKYAKGISNKVDDEKLERILMLAEWLYTDGVNFRAYGIEGVDWEVVDGKARSLLPEGTSLANKYQGLGFMEIAGWGQGTLSGAYMYEPEVPIYDPAITALKDAHIASTLPYLVDFSPAIMTAMTPSKDNFTSGMSGWEEHFMTIISSPGDAGAAFDEYVANLTNLYGYKDFLAELNEIYPAP